MRGTISKEMKREVFNDMSGNEIFAMINRLQRENARLSSEGLALKEKIEIYKTSAGTIEEAEISFQSHIQQNGQRQEITFEELTGSMPSELLEDDFTPEMKL